MVFHSPVALPAEATGFVRIAEQRVDVNIVGQAEIIPKADVGGRIVIQPGELAKLVRNTKRLKKILADAEAKALIDRKGL